MNRKNKIYEFDDFYIDENERRLYHLGEPVPLQPKAFDILFLLIQNAGSFMTLDEIINNLWDEENVENNAVTIQMVPIRKALKEEKKGDFIKAYRKAYQFVKPVVIREADILNVTHIELDSDETVSSAFPPVASAGSSEKSEIEGAEVTDRHGFLALAGTLYALIIIFYGITTAPDCEGECFEKNVFIGIASISIGLVMANCLVLEGAYQFDQFRRKMFLFLPVFVLINGGSMFTGLSLINTYQNLFSSAAIGFICLVSGLIVSTVLARTLLPDVPVTTAANIQTQPAFAAFLKNVFLYILPLYTLFCLLIACFLFSGHRYLLVPVYPISLFVLWLIFVFVSYLLTSYLLNDLVREKDQVTYTYHGLFVLLIFVRFILFFGPAFVFILWYFFKTIALIPMNAS